jgi:hypothetical protein
MNTKLIIVDGHCSVGKSSISKSITKQISLHQNAYWLHEECENHPIRHDEFSFGALDTAEGMELNRLGMLTKWEVFRDSIKASGKVCITEGCLLHAYDRYFIHSSWKENEMLAYYAQVLEVLDELDPIIVFLYRPDLRKSLEKAFIARGNWWRDLILRRDDQHVYFKDHAYVDENSMFEAVEFEQGKMLAQRSRSTQVKNYGTGMSRRSFPCLAQNLEKWRLTHVIPVHTWAHIAGNMEQRMMIGSSAITRVITVSMPHCFGHTCP